MKILVGGVWVVYLYRNTRKRLCLNQYRANDDNFPMSDEIVISRMLKHLMNEKRMTFKRLSQLSGVPISTIKTWSSGVEPKSLSAARKVARTLGVSVEYLVFGESDQKPPTLGELLTTQLFSGWCKVTIEMPVTSPIPKEKKDLK